MDARHGHIKHISIKMYWKFKIAFQIIRDSLFGTILGSIISTFYTNFFYNLNLILLYAIRKVSILIIFKQITLTHSANLRYIIWKQIKYYLNIQGLLTTNHYWVRYNVYGVDITCSKVICSAFIQRLYFIFMVMKNKTREKCN